MSRIKIDKNDKERVLLTELLPYEVPILFSNDDFYKMAKDGSFEYFRNLTQVKSHAYTIPFNYEITKSADNDTRLLSLIHPASQINFIEFYNRYDSVIIHLCSKSPFSLRRVSNVAKYCYTQNMVFDEDEHKVNERETEPEFLDQESKVFKSYFTYSPIDLIYKFFEKSEYQRLEQRFNFLMEFDISKCFYNIYTHTIAWAVKNKESAKQNKGKSFESIWDGLMQKANYNETNGIIVGPEVSRIFAEVILQQIDLNVLEKLNTTNIKQSVHYEIRRYVDDFFVFANSEDTLDTILKFYKRELEVYKLYINHAKTKKRKTPFITDIAVGKREIRKLMRDFFNTLITSETIDNVEIKKIKQISSTTSVAQEFIRDFQCIVKRNNLTYDNLNREIIRHFKGVLVQVFKDKTLNKSQPLFENFLLTIIDILFYAYSLNINSSSTYKVTQIIILITKFIEGKSDDYKHTIFSKILKESEFVITTFQRKSKSSETNIETLNLLIALKQLGHEYLLSNKKIKELFLSTYVDVDGPSDKVQAKFNYFHIVTLLYYFDNFTEFEDEKKILETIVIEKLNTEQVFVKAELFCLFFDVVCCPYVSDKTKKQIFRVTNYVRENKIGIEMKKIQEKGSWFMNWNKDVDLEQVLKKKEWGATY